jgi:hypothetical protein
MVARAVIDVPYAAALLRPNRPAFLIKVIDPPPKSPSFPGSCRGMKAEARKATAFAES